MRKIFDAHSDYGWQVMMEKHLGDPSTARLHRDRVYDGGIRMEVLTVGGQIARKGVDWKRKADILATMDAVASALSDPGLGYHQVLNFAPDFDEDWDDESIGWTFAFEGVGPIHNEGDFAEFHEKGLRVLGLVMGRDNQLACVRDSVRNGPGNGLTVLGKEVLKAIKDYPVIIDLSHVTDSCVYDCLDILETPPVISHGAAQSLCPVARNFPDDVIKAVANSGGVIGIFNIARALFCGSEREKYGDSARLEDWFRHVDHVVNLVGPEFVAIGTDYMDYLEKDFNMPGKELPPPLDEIPHCGFTYKFLQYLSDKGYSEDVLHDIGWGNFARVYKASIGSKV